MFKIGELASKTGLTAHTIRFYEKNGLINASQRSEAGYRYYAETDVRQAEFVKTARKIGFSIDDVATLLSIRVDKRSHTCQDVTDVTQRELNDVNEKISELLSMQQTLQILLNSCCGGPESATHCSIMEALDASNAISARSRVQ
jgi:MerR family Zn(II)-responsive transcriptional regulator of zntA